MIWSKQSFDLELKSYEGNCDLCWKKSNRKLMTLVVENPDSVNWWRDVGERYEYYTPISREGVAKPPYRFYRDNMSIDDIIEESKFPFRLAVDESKIIDTYKQMQLFDSYMDSNDGCTESCELF